jgi:hypothetical protein
MIPGNNGQARQNGKSHIALKDVKSRQKFSDGSEIIELMNGASLILEGNSKSVPIFAEQPAPYNQPAPKPKETQ